MLDWLSKRFSSPTWDLSTMQDPWPGGTAIADFLATQLDASGDRLVHSGVPLPDDDRLALADGVRFSAGARDGIALFHIDSVDEPEVAAEIIGRIRAVVADGGLVHLPALYRNLARHRALSWIDELGAGVALEPPPDPQRLYALGLYLLTQAPDREAVKAGIAMLALLDLSEDDLSLLQRVGSHDEFTLYAAVAVGAQSDNADAALWAMARRVRGWGRIHAVLRLTDTGDPQIQAWLLREGFRNDVMDRYLALPCAEAGDLVGALAEQDLDLALRDGATAILAALLEPAGPTPGMEAWEEGATAVSRWLDHVERDPDFPLAAVPVLARIEAAGRADPSPWPPEAASGLSERVRALLTEARWPTAVRAGLAQGGSAVEGSAVEGSAVEGSAVEASAVEGSAVEGSAPELAATELAATELAAFELAAFELAAEAAPFVGVDTYEAWLARCTPSAARPWARAVAAAGPHAGRLDRVLDRARALLPADLAAGEHGRGSAPVTAPAAVLSTLLQALARHPGKAPDLVQQGLASPLAQHRNLALRALVAWPHDLWPEGAHERVARLSDQDPEETVRSNAAAAWGASVEA